MNSSFQSKATEVFRGGLNPSARITSNAVSSVPHCPPLTVIRRSVEIGSKPRISISHCPNESRGMKNSKSFFIEQISLMPSGHLEM